MFLVGALLRFGFVTAWLFHLVACMGSVRNSLCEIQQIQRMRYNASRNIQRRFGSRYNRTLESTISPERQLELSRERRAQLVPAEVLYSSNRSTIQHRVYQHYSERRILVTDTRQSSGCLGCDAKHKLMKSQESQTLPASRPCMAEGVWTTSRCDVDNSAVPSLGTISSIDTPNPTLDSHGTRNTSQDFINHGFLFWNQSRQQWIGSNEKSNQGDLLRESRLSWNETYVSLLGSNKPFATPVPLSEMVDFLVDVWEQEGMYD